MHTTNHFLDEKQLNDKQIHYEFLNTGTTDQNKHRFVRVYI